MKKVSDIKKLVEKIGKHEWDDFKTHNQYASFLYGIGNEENVAKMSELKHFFRRYIIKENGRNSTKYRWNIDEIKKDHFQSRKFDSPIYEMIGALYDELEAAKKDVQRNSYKIRKIDTIRLGLDNVIYACRLEIKDDEYPKIKDGCAAEIRGGSQIASAILIEYNASTSTAYLKSQKDLSKLKLKKPKLFVDLTWLLEKMIDKLSKIDLKNKSSNDNLPVCEFINQSFNIRLVKKPPIIYPKELTPSQDDAYQKSLGQNFNLIWGPPGTGKSHTLGRVLFSLASYNQSTVVCCISNVAVDSLMKAFSKSVREYEKNGYISPITEGMILRHGITKDEEILNDPLFVMDDEEINILKIKIVETRRLLRQLNEGKLPERLLLKKELDEYYKELKVKNQAKLKLARIIFMTAAQFNAFTDFEEVPFNNIVIDEASMMYPPQFIALCSSITDRIILAGDFRQLGPVFLSRTPIAIKWLEKDLFIYSKIFDRFGRNVENRKYLSKLIEQFRSHEYICDLINGAFYGGELESNYTPPDNEIKLGEPINQRVVTYYNLEKHSEFRVKRSAKGSRNNTFSANISVKIALDAALNENVESIAVITPYRSQVNELKSLLNGINEVHKSKIKVGTVHSFQGSEADVVIIDLVDAPNERIGLLYQGKTGERLINVAVSRAKHKLIIVGNVKMFLEGGGHTLVSDLSKKVLKTINIKKIDFTVD